MSGRPCCVCQHMAPVPGSSGELRFLQAGTRVVRQPPPPPLFPRPAVADVVYSREIKVDMLVGEWPCSCLFQLGCAFSPCPACPRHTPGRPGAHMRRRRPAPPRPPAAAQRPRGRRRAPAGFVRLWTSTDPYAQTAFLGDMLYEVVTKWSASMAVRRRAGAVAAASTPCRRQLLCLRAVLLAHARACLAEAVHTRRSPRSTLPAGGPAHADADAVGAAGGAGRHRALRTPGSPRHQRHPVRPSQRIR